MVRIRDQPLNNHLTNGRDIHTTSGSGEHSSSQVVDGGYQEVFLFLANFCIKLKIKNLRCLQSQTRHIVRKEIKIAIFR